MYKEKKKICIMEQKIRIVITDKNRNVRTLLQREFMSEGYEAYIAENGIELCGYILSNINIDLMILDPEIPYINYILLNNYIQRHRPDLPIIMHVFGIDESIYSINNIVAVIEKKPDLNLLKQKAAQILSNNIINLKLR